MAWATVSDEPENQTYHLKDRLAYFALRCAICIIQIMSLERCDRVCQLLATLLSDWIPLRRELIAENFRLVFPEWSEQKCRRVKFEMWHHLLLMCCEIAQAPRKVHRENWHKHFRISDRKGILRVVMSERPGLLVSGHFGNFELAGFVTGLFGMPSTTLARPLDNGFVHDYVMSFRSMGGQHFLPKDGSSQAIQELLQSGGKLALLADQHAGRKGCWVDFLGHPASCHKALALFTLSNGAPMLVCSNVRKDRPLQFDLTLLGIADPAEPDEHLASVTTLTRWYNQCLERAILKNPEQYWWVHRRWRELRPARNQQAA